MQCERCNGGVTWRGPFSALTHTECGSCGGINCQRIEAHGDDGGEDDCPRCHGDGTNPLTNYLTPCPECQGELNGTT